jgi:hypothetical protein
MQVRNEIIQKQGRLELHEVIWSEDLKLDVLGDGLT